MIRQGDLEAAQRDPRTRYFFDEFVEERDEEGYVICPECEQSWPWCWCEEKW